MRCEEIRLEAPAYLAGELGDEQRLQVSDHLAGCAECRVALAELESVVQLLSKAPLEHMPKESLEDEIFSLVELNGVARLVAAAPIEHDPPIDLERRALAKAGVLQRIVIPSGRWARVAATLAPGFAAAAVVLAVVALNSRSQVNNMENQLGVAGQSVLNVQLTGLTTPPPSGEAGVWEHGEDHYVITVHASGLTPQPGQHYELWMSGPEGRLLAGTFAEADTIPALFSLSENPLDYPDVSIWLEPDDGDYSTVTGEAIMEASLVGAVPSPTVSSTP